MNMLKVYLKGEYQGKDKDYETTGYYLVVCSLLTYLFRSVVSSAITLAASLMAAATETAVA